MASRLSNLTNHVRRHSTLKQFQCCYCDYTHNEKAKVRLHMLLHKDKDSQPIDNLSPEMQTSWDLLMQQCFPDHYQDNQSGNNHSYSRRQQGNTSAPISQHSGMTSQPSIRSEVSSAIGAPMIRPCFECGEMVNPLDRLEHIRQNHMECYPYVCSLCGYDHPDQGKILLHIKLKHGDSTSAQVFTRDILIVAEALIPKYFPESQTSSMDTTSAPTNGQDPVTQLQQAKNTIPDAGLGQQGTIRKIRLIEFA